MFMRGFRGVVFMSGRLFGNGLSVVSNLSGSDLPTRERNDRERDAYAKQPIHRARCPSVLTMALRSMGPLTVGPRSGDDLAGAHHRSLS